MTDDVEVRDILVAVEARLKGPGWRSRQTEHLLDLHDRYMSRTDLYENRREIGTFNIHGLFVAAMFDHGYPMRLSDDQRRSMWKAVEEVSHSDGYSKRPEQWTQKVQHEGLGKTKLRRLVEEAIRRITLRIAIEEKKRETDDAN